MDDGGAGIYEQFAREAVADRRRTRVALAAALVLHLVVLLAPWRGADPESWGAMPPARGEAFELRPLHVAPPEPPPTPLPTPEPVVYGPPAEATAQVLVAEGAAEMLVPPQPVMTPPPNTPAALWSRGFGAEVLLTVVVESHGDVAEVTVEEVRLLRPVALEAGADGDERGGEEPTRLAGGGGAAAEGAGGDEGAAPAEAAALEVSDAELAVYGEMAAEAVRQWRFLPGTLAGNPIHVGVGVVITFPVPVPRSSPALAAEAAEAQE